MRFVVEQPLVVAVASSLTELFAPAIHRERIAGMLENYDFIDDSVMAYFKRRLAQAPRDADFALKYVKDNAQSRAEQEACVDAVRFKCDVLVGAARRARSRLCRGPHSAGRRSGRGRQDE